MNFLDILQPNVAKKPSLIKSNLSELKFTRTHSGNIGLWPAGEKAALDRLENFLQVKVKLYNESRNSPIIDGTSRISPYLALGILSPKRCILEGLKLNNFEFTAGSKGICKWIDEIVWREFYRNIMHSFPKVSKGMPFQDYTKKIVWRFDQDEFAASSNANKFSIEMLIEDYIAVRTSTITLFKSFDTKALQRIGVASNSNLSVRACGYIICGHERHHILILKERYL